MSEHSTVRSPPHFDAPWVNSPILLTSGPLRGKWIRAELAIQQQPRRGRKGAIHDLRPLHPPPTARLRLYELHHPVPTSSIVPGSNPPTLQFHSYPSPPPLDCREEQITITPRLTTHFLCLASLFQVQPPTREREYGRVDRKITVGNVDANDVPVDAEHPPPQTTVVERPKSDKRRPWRMSRPHPMTAISCHDPTWAAALNAALAKYQQDGSPGPLMDILEAPQESSRDIETIDGDLTLQDMIRLEPYLPREAPKWVIPYVDKTAQLSKRETAGHLIPSVENGEPALYFVFSDLAIRTEGYFALRLHVVNLDWRVDSRFSRQGPGFFAPLADCVTDTFAVYSTKEFPGLPPTTEFTTYLVSQGVRIRFRDDRAVDAAVGERRRVEGKPRPARRSSHKSNEDNSTDEPSGFDANRVSSSSPISPSHDGVKVDPWNPEMIRAATEVWKNSPGSGFVGLSRIDIRDERSNGPDVPSPSSAYPPFSPHEVTFAQQVEPQQNRPYLDSPITAPVYPVRSGQQPDRPTIETSQYVQSSVWNEAGAPMATSSPVFMPPNWRSGPEEHYAPVAHPSEPGPGSYHSRERRNEYRYTPYHSYPHPSPEPVSPQHHAPLAPQYPPSYPWQYYGTPSQAGSSYSNQYSHTSDQQSSADNHEGQR